MNTIVVGGLLSPFLLTGGLSAGSGPGGQPGPYLAQRYFPPGYFAPRYWGWSNGPPPIVPPDLESAVIARFQATTPLAPLAARMFTGNVPQFPARPHLIISHVDGRPELNSSTSFAEEYRLQYTIVSENFQEARTLGWALYSALIPRPENPPLVFADGSEDTRLLGSHRYYWGPGPSSAAQALCYWTFSCTHRVGRDFTVG